MTEFHEIETETVDAPEGNDIIGQLTFRLVAGRVELQLQLPAEPVDRLDVLFQFRDAMDHLGGTAVHEFTAQYMGLTGEELDALMTQDPIAAEIGLEASYQEFEIRLAARRSGEDQAYRDAEDREREQRIERERTESDERWAGLFDHDGAKGAEQSDTEGGESDTPESEPYNRLGN